MDERRPRVVILNGGSSSGKSTLGSRLQEKLAGFWLRLGVDTLIDLAPTRLLEGGDGLELADDGTVHSGPGFTELERQWMAGVAAMADAGARLIIEENFLAGAAGQQRWQTVLGHTPVGWVGVRCPAEVAAARESARGDRVSGMAADQAESVHRGVGYDLEVDTSASDPEHLAAEIADFFRLPVHQDRKG